MEVRVDRRDKSTGSESCWPKQPTSFWKLKKKPKPVSCRRDRVLLPEALDTKL